MITPEQELWACALHIERLHGENASSFIAERIQALTLAADMAGVERWQAIADKLDQVTQPPSRPPQ